MNCRAIVKGEIPYIPVITKIGVGIVTVITYNGAFDRVDTTCAQGIKNLVNDVGLLWQKDRAQRGVAHATDDNIALETAVLDHAIEIDRSLETEVRPHQAKCCR